MKQTFAVIFAVLTLASAWAQQKPKLAELILGTDGSTDWLKVIEWNASQIIATDDLSICITSQTIFDLKRKTVIALDIRKPEAQGLGGACNLLPDRQTYYLQDKVDYFAQKSVGATK